MKRTLYNIAVKLKIVRYGVEERGVAALETVILFPILISLLMGCYDLGQGILMNQKTIGASQIIGDLIARNREITMSGLEDMIRAGELAYEPYSTQTFGYDIVSMQFDADGNPVVLWRVTDNMQPNQDAIDSTDGLGGAGEGLIVVTTSYRYDPAFSGFVVPHINMQEVAFLKGRASATVVCDDCS